MRFLFSVILLSIFIFSLSCKTTTLDQSSRSSSEIQLEEPQEKPQGIVIPVSSLGDVSETRQQILQNSLEDELKEHFTLISQERFEEAQEKAFEELDYEECTEDQCIMLIQEMLQVENVFHLQVIGEGSNTQLSLSWRTLDVNKKETDSCIDCGTFDLDNKIKELVNRLTREKEYIVQRGKKESPDDSNKTITNKINIFSGFSHLTIWEEKNTPNGYDKDHFYLDLQINLGRMIYEKFDYKNRRFRIVVSRFRELSPERLELQFALDDFEKGNFDKMSICVNDANHEFMLSKHGSDSYWISIVLSQSMLNFVDTSKCFIQSLEKNDQIYLKNIFYNIEHIFNSTYRTDNIVISSHSIYSDQKYWKRLRKDNEIDFWNHWIKLIKNNSTLIYY